MKTTDECVFVTNEHELDEILRVKDRAVVLIYATWCPFCVSFLPVFKKYAQSTADFVLAQDNEERVADRYGVDVVPTVIFFVNGQVSKRLDGALGKGLNEKQLQDFINKCNLPDA